MLRFANPFAFYLLLLIPAFLIVAKIFSVRIKKMLSQLLGQHLFEKFTRSVSEPKRRRKRLLQSLSVFFLIIALARPQAGTVQNEMKVEGIEIIFALDVSESMLAEDSRPSRLEQAKLEISKLIDLLNGNRIGIVIFAGNATLLSPLTTDPGALKLFLDSASPDMMTNQGTCFECALSVAEDAFNRGGITAGPKLKTTRVIIMASDGEDQEPGAISKAQKLAELGFHLITVAYGTQAGGKIPVRDNLGYLKDFKKDRSGEVIITKVNGEALRKLAEVGKGEFFFSQFGGESVKSLVDKIKEYEKSTFDSKLNTEYEEKYQIFLFLAILLGMFEFLIGERAVLGILAILFLSSCGDIDYWLKNKHAIEQFKNTQMSQAHDEWQQLLQEEPKRYEAHMNMGIADAELGQNEQTISGLLNAEKYAEGADKFFPRFNLGFYFGKAKKYDEALFWYQKALEIDPDSKEIKTNIELLIQQQQQQQQKQDQKSGDSKKDPGQGKGKGDKDKDKSEDKKDSESDKQDKPKDFKDNPKDKPNDKTANLTPGDAQKILEEIRQQEKKIRKNYFQKNRKEERHDKDW